MALAADTDPDHHDARNGAWQPDPALVTKLNAQRPGVNHDEALVGDYELPDPLRRLDGKRVRSARDWPRRRAEVLELFRTHVYGRRPGRPEAVRCEVVAEQPDAMGGAATLRRVVIRSEHAGRAHTFNLTIFLPNAATRPVPVFLLINNRGMENVDPTRANRSGFWPAEQIVARGYGAATFHYAELAPDDAGTFRDEVIAMYEPVGDDADATGGGGDDRAVAATVPSTQAATATSTVATTRPLPPRAGDAWGALAAWGWGASRVLDYLQTDPDRIDATRVAVLGHSRGGKAALWAGAEDRRFGLVISNESGCGGAALSRRDFGETVRIINDKFPHWFCGHFKRYNDRERELPVDQHMLIALIAPRPVYVASAGDDLWADPKGEFLSLAHASPVYALWGHKPIKPGAMPPIDTPLVAARRGYHVRTGKHDLTPYDWDRFMDFADRLGWQKR